MAYAHHDSSRNVSGEWVWNCQCSTPFPFIWKQMRRDNVQNNSLSYVSSLLQKSVVLILKKFFYFFFGIINPHNFLWKSSNYAWKLSYFPFQVLNNGSDWLPALFPSVPEANLIFYGILIIAPQHGNNLSSSSFSQFLLYIVECFYLPIILLFVNIIIQKCFTNKNLSLLCVAQEIS